MDNFKKYGVPFYGISFVPQNVVRSSDTEPTPKEEHEESGNNESKYVIFSGGGGEGRSGIPNALVVSLFNSASNSLSDEPVENFGTGDDLAYRMVVHPVGDGVICSFIKSCSFGIIVMEFITRKRPTGLTEEEGIQFTLPQLVDRALSNGVNEMIEIVDPDLSSNFSTKKGVIEELMKLALSCTRMDPDDRLDMNQILSSLTNISKKV